MWNCIQSAVQGKGHVSENRPCQDKVFFLKQNDCTVISLADGAGSAKLSHFGAESITQYICEDFVLNFDTYFNAQDGILVKENLLTNIISCLEKTAVQYNCLLHDLASTLLVVAIKDDNFILLHIGDGVIGYMINEELKVASKPNNGEFANTTVFTTSENALVTMRLIKASLKNINGFVLMSDGCEASFYQKKENMLAPAIKSIMNLMSLLPLDKLESQLNKSMQNVIAKNTTDDCSIIIISRDNFDGYSNLSKDERCRLFRINDNRKQYNRFNAIIYLLQQERSLKEVSMYIHLKPKYTKRKYIDKLIQLNLIEQKNNRRYKIILIMEKYK